MKLVVLGDALLDVDVDGRACRLAPDAPVPVIDRPTIMRRPGGAALAAALLASDGMDVSLVAAIGGDAAGRALRRLLCELGVELVDVRTSAATPQKVRIRAGGHCVARVDFGSDGPVPARDLDIAAANVADARAALVADYGCGVAAMPALRGALHPDSGQTVVWDPHPRGPAPVPGVQLVTPNESEAAAFDGAAPDTSPIGAADLARRLQRRWRVGGVAVTCGARGAALATGDDVPLIVPVEQASAGDACGAGDRFASAALRTLATGALPSEAVRSAVVAASAYVRDGVLGSFGRPDGATSERRPTVVATSGCFDLLHAGHVSALRAARALGDRLVVCLNSDASVRRLKGPGRPVNACADREAVLRSLAFVDEVIEFEEDTPLRVLDRLRPDVFAKGGDYDAATLPEAALLAQWGGRTVVVPYLHGRSTTRILEEARYVSA
jgi:rfaE bifunctional protein nucleotidyltransferase chain/domain/rfaE bifunctional protein kinase chain/domain